MKVVGGWFVLILNFACARGTEYKIMLAEPKVLKTSLNRTIVFTWKICTLEVLTSFRFNSECSSLVKSEQNSDIQDVPMQDQ